MNNLCSTCCVCLWEPPGRWLQRAGVRGPLWDVQFRTQTVVQLWAGAVGLGCWGCQGAAQPAVSQECSLRQQWQGRGGQERAQLPGSLSGERGVMGELGKCLQGQISKFMGERKALAFVPSLPLGQQRATAFVIPDQH